MNEVLVKKLNQLNIDFYQKTASYFDSSRKYSWQGWEKLVNYIPQRELKVLDLGCGNGRFYKFLKEQSSEPNSKLQLTSYTGLEQDPTLLKLAQQKYSNHITKFIEADLLSFDFSSLKQKYDLIVIFGVMHHIPGFTTRLKLLKDIYTLLSKNSLLAVSFWDFFSQKRFTNKIVTWDKVAVEKTKLEPGDYLLDWQRGIKAFRYCHWVNEDEITDMIAKLPYQKYERYLADGKTGKLNKYLLLSN